MSETSLPRKIRVGIIGASADPWAWAATAHIPALRSLPDYEVLAVASRNQGNADTAAAAHGIPLAFGNYRDMLARSDLDMICVSTSSAHHHELVMPAIAAGKHVFCEWPFGVDIQQAIEMRDAARHRGVRTLVGLQTSCAPIVTYVRDLIADGYLGKLWSVNFYRANDQTVQKAASQAYLEFLEKANAGLRIMAGHGLDTLAAYVGEFVDLQAYMEVEMNTIMLAETGKLAPVTHKDHILVQGRLAEGAVVSALMKMNSPTYKAFHLELSGSQGGLVITTDERLKPGDRHPGVPSEFAIYATPALGQPFQPLSVPARYRGVPEATPAGQPFDVAHMYQMFAQAMARNEVCKLDFDHGVMRHRLLETIELAAASGQRQCFAK